MSLHEACAVLSVGTACHDAVELRRSYLAAIRTAHPDLNHAADAHLRTTRLSEAYRVLSAALAEFASIGDALAAAESAGAASSGSTRASSTEHSNSADYADRGDSTNSADQGATRSRHVPPPPPRWGFGRGGFAPDPDSAEAETYEIEGWVRIIADDTIELGAPLDLAFRWLELACHRAGDITYLDRPAAMLQVLVQFVGYPPSYVVFDLQGRAAYGTTEVFCTIASLEDRPPPPIDGVTHYLAEALNDVLD